MVFNDLKHEKEMYSKQKPGQTPKDKHERIAQDAETKSERIKHKFNYTKKWT